jgi:hypothetical protein
MKNLVAKKNVLIFSIICVFLFLVSGFQKNIGLCGKVYNQCWDILDLLWPVFSLSLPLVIFSLITYKLPEQVFRSWLNFAFAWIPISLLFIFTTPTTSHSWAISVGQGREGITLIMGGLFALISLILIACKFFALKKGVVGK